MLCLSPSIRVACQKCLAQASDIHREKCHPLTDVVVQLSRDASALLLLRCHQPATQIRKRALVLAQVVFGASPSHAIHQQGANQERLGDYDERANDDAPLEAVPDAGLAKPNHAARWQQTLTDAPPLQLARIEHRGPGLSHWCLDARRRFALQDTARDVGGTAAEFVDGQQSAADNAVAQEAGLASK